MKLPNGYGSVYKEKRNLRKPWRAVKTIGWKDYRQQRKVIGYFATKREALAALASCADVPCEDMTFTEVYEKWYAEHEPTVSASVAASYRLAYSRCKTLWKKRMRDIRVTDLESVIGMLEADTSKRNMLSLFHAVFGYAMRHEWLEKDCSRLLRDTPRERSEKHKAFTEDEIRKLWEHTDEDIVKIILVGIYSGWRPAELMTMECQGGVMHGGMKTKAGRDRIVPVHSAVAGFVDFRKVSVPTYGNAFRAAMDGLGMSHLPHDTRVTFATLCDRYGSDRTAVKVMMGHAMADVTEAVYIRKNIEDLKKEIEKIPNFR